MTVISELQQDHVNLSKLLEILDKKIIKLKDGNQPNIGLMADVIGYIANYAEGYHHPKEDEVFAFFKGRDTKLDGVMQECEVAHTNLKGFAHALLEVIDGVLHDAVMPMDNFIEKLEDFVRNEKKHLDFEEASVFPVLNEVATDADWKAVEAGLPIENDPLFGEKRSEEYKALYVELMRDINS
ncbi:hemerythrin domain-containing protein [Neptunomonas sp.]|uniref:hemerythrin domain-containing protein n=1 Tax=Neptunomonas sp. TaxID=1971898 RepID=UPI0025CE89EA|nr:hemerythrin domain-containing protein [Neptunomonas sp.]